MIPIELKRRYPNSRDEDITDAFMRGYQSAKGEIVRCKDCEYKSDWNGVYNHDTELFCYLHECGMDNNDFCSKARMKGGAE